MWYGRVRRERALSDLRSNLASVWMGPSRYPGESPYHPAEKYPEYPFAEVVETPNAAYEGIRESFRLLGLDAGNYGTRAWNPLSDLVRPGDNVLIKPNFIRQGHLDRTEEWEQVITHPSVIRAVLDYVYIALGGHGRVTIADGPQTDSDFTEICRRTALEPVAAFFRERGLEVSIVDLRRERWLQNGGVTYLRDPLPGDPLGYTTVDLGKDSEFRDYPLNGRVYGADYDRRETARAHQGGQHAYVLCRTAMDADVIINLPKMKTHKKTGVTLSLKNMVGVNGHRNCIPHYTTGTPAEGGDEFPNSSGANRIQSAAIAAFKRRLTRAGGCGGSLSRLAVRFGKVAFGDTSRVIRSGNWYGNNTLWRAVLDLNKALFYFDGDGKERLHPVRYLTLVDGIVAGEGDGPSSPDRKEAGLVVAGFNPVAVDTVCATIMGFDFQKVPLLRNAWCIERYPLVDFRGEDILCKSNIAAWCGDVSNVSGAEHLGFRPHFGWIGHIEREDGGRGSSCPPFCAESQHRQRLGTTDIQAGRTET